MDDFTSEGLGLLDKWPPGVTMESCLKRAIYIAARNARTDDELAVLASLQSVKPELVEFCTVLVRHNTIFANQLIRDLQYAVALYEARHLRVGSLFEVIPSRQDLLAWSISNHCNVPFALQKHLMVVEMHPDPSEDINNPWLVEEDLGLKSGAPAINMVIAALRGEVTIRAM